MRVAFHSPEDAVTFCIQVQLNLLCAPWSPALEDGGNALFSGNDPTWASSDVPMMEQHHEAIIKDLPFTGAFSGSNEKSPSDLLFDVQRAAETALSWNACKEAPTLVVHHSSSTLPLPIFRGLRVRMGIHTGVANEGGQNTSMRYAGQMMEVTKAVSDLPCGGQIVMTGETLAEIESMHALLARVSKQCEGWRSGLEGSMPTPQEPEEAAMSVMHLGSHVLLKDTKPRSSSTTESLRSVDLDARFQSIVDGSTPAMKDRRGSNSSQQSAAAAEAMLQNLRNAHDVVMVVPWPLRARAMYFPPLKSVMEVTPAWHGSPGPKDVTILFTFIENWTLLKRWERETPCAHGVVTHSLELHDSMVRALLLEHNGYEVEGEDGCFVCAFQLAVDAIEFSVALQEALLRGAWDSTLLTTPWGCEQTTASGQLLHRGLRVAVGMCTGNARRYQPSLRTGRMEYFGPLMNHAARVAVAAHGGQILVHNNCLSSIGDTNPQMLDLITATLHSMGVHKLKGIATSVEIFQVSPEALEGRVFPPIKTSTTKLVQPDENADSIFRYGLDHATLPSGKGNGPGSVNSSGSLREYERFAQKLISGSTSGTPVSVSLDQL